MVHDKIETINEVTRCLASWVLHQAASSCTYNSNLRGAREEHRRLANSSSKIEFNMEWDEYGSSDNAYRTFTKWEYVGRYLIKYQTIGLRGEIRTDSGSYTVDGQHMGTRAVILIGLSIPRPFSGRPALISE